MAKGELPYCTVCVVVCAIACHILVLVGNLKTAGSIHSIGLASHGWSDVGISLGHSLNNDLDVTMHQAITNFTSALQTATRLETDIELVLAALANVTDRAVSSAMEIDSATNADVFLEHMEETEASSFIQRSAEVCDGSHCGNEEALVSLLQGRIHMQLAASDLDEPSPRSDDDISSKGLVDARTRLRAHIKMLVARIEDRVHELFMVLKPALLQIGKWLDSMGPRMQNTLEEVGIVVDHVQKLIDEVMSRVAGRGKHGDALLSQGFSLFDVDETGFISMRNIHEVAILYGITAFQRQKGESLFKKYDTDTDGKLSKQEFSSLVKDSSIPHVLTSSLRTYARKLSEISGVLKAARQRDEVAHAAVQYMTLAATKNRSKTKLVVKAFESLPLDFVADVFTQLVDESDNPGISDVVDVGPIVMREFAKSHSQQAQKAMQLMADSKWWHASGFDLRTQPHYVKRVLQWLKHAQNDAVSPQLLQMFGGVKEKTSSDVSNLETLAEDAVRRNSRKLAMEHRQARAQEVEKLLSSATSSNLVHNMVGASVLLRTTDPDVSRVVKGGATAKASTLQFAKGLAQDSSSTADRILKLCFDHAHTSSNAVDSFATQLQGMLKKTQTFLRLMQRYSTPHGTKALEARIDKFLEHGAAEVYSIIDRHVNATLSKRGVDPGKFAMLQSTWPLQEQVDGIWKDIVKITRDFQAVLPPVIDNMKFARREVSRLSATMLAIFPVVQEKTPPIFHQHAHVYAAIWIVYFIIFFILSLCALYYGLWASGYFSEEEATDPHQRSRFENCLYACAGCLDRLQESQVRYWSVVLAASSVACVMFTVCCVLTLFAAIESWIGVSCGEFYVLSDNTICGSTMLQIQQWLSTFWSANVQQAPIHNMCESRGLLLCHVISGKMKQSAIFTTLGSSLAALFTCQIIFESARLHEKAKWQRRLEENKVTLAD